MLLLVVCRKKDQERSLQKKGESYIYPSIEKNEMKLFLDLFHYGLFHHELIHHVVELLGFMLDAPQPDGPERNLALILPLYEGGSLHSFVKARKGNIVISNIKLPFIIC